MRLMIHAERRAETLMYSRFVSLLKNYTKDIFYNNFRDIYTQISISINCGVTEGLEFLYIYIYVLILWMS